MIENLVYVAVVVQIVGKLSYVKDTLKGKTRPNRISWLLWAIAPLIAASAAVSDGVTLAAVPVFVSGLAPLLVLLASFANRNSYWKLEKSDYLCGLFSLLALVLWGVTKEPTVAIVFALLSDLLATLPTLIKSWKFPETETADAYWAGLFSALTSFTAINAWNFSSVTFPTYLVLVNVSLVVCIYRKKIFPAQLRSGVAKAEAVSKGSVENTL